MNMVEEYKLKRILDQTIKRDSFNSDNTYLIRSLYFDSINDKDYFEKMDGVENRRKIRIRIYNCSDDFIKLELKQKTGQYQLKRSLRISREDAIKLINREYSCLLKYDDPFAAEIYTIMSLEMYRPVCVVDYDRRAYYADENDIRITIDSNIRASESNFNIFDKDLLTVPVNDPSKIILEVKYNRFLLSYIKDILSIVDKSETSNSKYVMARINYGG